MLALVAFGAGYVMGAREGREGLERVVAATRHVLASDEFKAMLEAAQTIAGGLFKQGLEQIGGAAFNEGRSLAGRLRVA